MKDSGCREEIRIIRLYFIFFPYDIANFDIGFEVKFKSDVFLFWNDFTVQIHLLCR